MKQYTVEIADEALMDMEQLYNHIAYTLFSPENAMAQYNKIAGEILTLDMFPERFRVVDFEPEHSREIRRMLVDNYSVFYVIRKNTVIVTAVLYSSSDIQRRLDKKKS